MGCCKKYLKFKLIALEYTIRHLYNQEEIFNNDSREANLKQTVKPTVFPNPLESSVACFI